VNAADRVIRWSTALAVLGVAGIAAVVSYEHASALVRAHGESGWTGRLIPLMVAWIAETEAEKATYALVMRRPGPRPRMTQQEINSIVDKFAYIARVLIDADPEDKAEIFRQLGLKLTYRPGRKLVEANVQLAQFGFSDGVRGPTRTLRTRSTSR